MSNTTSPRLVALDLDGTLLNHQGQVTPRTRQVLDRYLDQSIVEYSTWMDRYRTAPGYEITTYWHMVTIDKDGSVPPEPLRPNGDGDAVRQLTRAIERLRSYRQLSRHPPRGRDALPGAHLFRRSAGRHGRPAALRLLSPEIQG